MQKRNHGKLVVGVGASAGGLQALTALLRAVPAGRGHAYIIVQHLNPDHETQLPHLLAPETSLTVQVVAHDGTPVAADHVYVAPADREVTVEAGTAGPRLRLHQPDLTGGFRRSIDRLLTSLASALKSQAAGIVLSGTGSDGALGMEAIRAAGGLTIAQSPQSAAHGDMPQAAIDLLAAELVLEPEDMPRALDRPRASGAVAARPLAAAAAEAGTTLTARGDAHSSDDAGPPHDADGDDVENDDSPGGRLAGPTSRPRVDDEDVDADVADTALAEVGTDDFETRANHLLTILRERVGLELADYKPATAYRRIQRRMRLHGLSDINAYAKLVCSDDAELNQLARDMHISVTDFFRDPRAFEALQREVIRPLLTSLAKQEEVEHPIVRIWVPACATGEEAYSIAMIVAAERTRLRLDERVGIQIFATDIDDAVISTARKAMYPAAVLAQVPTAYRGAYFRPLEGQSLVRVHEGLRDLVTFARHDLLSHPPYSNLHLVSCRNLLIYLRRHAQNQVLDRFHFALRQEGTLMLGPSETLGDRADLFAVVNKKWRIHRKLDVVAPYRQSLPEWLTSRRGSAPPAEEREAKPATSTAGASRTLGFASGVGTAANAVLVEACLPASVIVNDRFRVLYLHGDLIEYLDLPRGPIDLIFFDMLRAPIRTRIRTAVLRAARESETVTAQANMTHRDGSPHLLTVTVRPAHSRALGDRIYVITFESTASDDGQPAAVEIGSGPDSVLSEVERELLATREDLKATVDELERANAALRAANDEAMTMNEELQSTNEELETQSEELRSVNEELVTVNGQLREKIDALQLTTDDLANLISSSRLPVIFLDRSFCIRRYTSPVTSIINIIDSDIGRPLHHLSGDCVSPDLIEDARQVLEGLTPVEKEICAKDERWYLRQVLPYRTADNRISGVVITFSDVSRLKRLTSELEVRERQQTAVTDLSLQGLRDNRVLAIMQNAVVAVARTLDCPLAKVLKLQPEGDRLLLVAGVGWHEGLVGCGEVPAEEQSQAGYTLMIRTPVVVEDFHTEKRFVAPQILRDHDVRSGMSVIIFGPGGKPYGVFGVHSPAPRVFTRHDVAFLQSVANVIASVLQRSDFEEHLLQSEERLRLIVQATRDAIWDIDLESGISWANQTYIDHFGPPDRHDVQLEWWARRISPQDRESTRNSLSSALESRVGAWQAEYEIADLSGRPRAVLHRALIARDVDGRPLRILGAMTDLTERREREQALRESEERFRTLADNISQFTWMADHTGWIFWYNKRWFDYTGTTLEEMQGWGWKKVHHPDHVDRVVSKVSHCFATGALWEDTFPLRSASGTYRWFLSRAVPIHDASGKVVRWFGTNTDITEQRTAERNIAEQQRRLQAIIDNAPAAIFVRDGHGRFVISNRAHAAFLGCEPADVVGKTEEDFEPVRVTADRGRNIDLEVWTAGRAIEFEDSVPTPEGMQHFIAARFPLRDIEGRIYAVCGIATNITQRKEDEQQLRAVMAELNHRVKNTLAVIDAIARQTTRAARSLDEFRDSFSARLRSMAAAHALLTRQDWKGVALRDIFLAELEPRVADPRAIEIRGPQLMMRPKAALALHMAVHELATNAAKYGALSTTHGTLTVHWQPVTTGATLDLAIEWTERGGPSVLHPDHNGYGTAMIDRTLQYELGGAIERDYAPDGLRCRIRLPLNMVEVTPAAGGFGDIPNNETNALERPQSAPTAEPGPDAAAPGAPGILIAEDSLPLSGRVENIVREAGFAVVGPASSLQSATRLAQRVNLLAAILDIDLDGQYVYPLARSLRARGVPLIFLTGFNPEDLPSDLRDLPMLSKPLHEPQLKAWLESTIPGGSPHESPPGNAHPDPHGDGNAEGDVDASGNEDVASTRKGATTTGRG